MYEFGTASTAALSGYWFVLSPKGDETRPLVLRCLDDALCEALQDLPFPAGLDAVCFVSTHALLEAQVLDRPADRKQGGSMTPR